MFSTKLKSGATPHFCPCCGKKLKKGELLNEQYKKLGKAKSNLIFKLATLALVLLVVIATLMIFSYCSREPASPDRLTQFNFDFRLLS